MCSSSLKQNTIVKFRIKRSRLNEEIDYIDRVSDLAALPAMNC